jgi:hypothetical protein
MPDDDFEHLNIMEGISAFQSARVRAFWDEMFSLLRGKPAELLSFDDVRARLRLRAEYYKGLRDVPLDQIVGSVGRYREFTSRFLPKKGVAQERWSRVYAQAYGQHGLPPIEVYQVGDVYFVRDGNHRVSVARQMGATFIQAHVTELPTSVCLKPGMSEEELDAAEAYAEFLAETRLSSTRPHHQPFTLTEPSRYHDLLGHVYLHQTILERLQNRSLTLDEAAADWYDNVYRPAVTLIRKYGILELADNRTETDLYLWLVEHLREVKELYGEKTDIRSFRDALVDFLSAKQMPIPEDLLDEKSQTVQIARVNLDEALDRYRERSKTSNGHHLDN